MCFIFNTNKKVKCYIWLIMHILYNTEGCPSSVFRPCSVGHKFYIQLALPISPEIMDRFWCSRCLNNCIKVPDMMRLFAGGATTPLVVKIWTKQPWVKIENLLFALPISPEIMDGFWCSRCLNDRIKVPDMMRLFAGGATTPLVVKIWTKQP